MNLIKRLLTLTEVRYWIGVIKSEFWDDKTRRNHIWALLIELFGVIGIGGATLTVIMINVGYSTGVDNKLDPFLPDAGVSINVPLSPGTTSALTICKQGIVEKAQVHIDNNSASMVNGYSAVLGPERLTYTDNPPGGKNLVIILNGNPQTVQPEVVKCLIKSAK